MHSDDLSSPRRLESFRLPSDKVWKDTSAQECFGSYLDDNPLSGNSNQRRGPIALNASGTYHNDITVGALGVSHASGRKEQFSGRRQTWPGALFLILMILSAAGAITYFGIQTFLRARDQHDLSARMTGSMFKAKKITPTKGMSRKFHECTFPNSCEIVCAMPNYVTSNGKIYITYGTEEREFIVQGVNWSGMENIEGVPHGLAYKQSNIVSAHGCQYKFSQRLIGRYRRKACQT